MSRKSVERRANIEQATQMLIDHGGNAAPSVDSDTEARRTADPERTARLLNYTPRLDANAVQSIREVAVDYVLRVPPTTLTSDRFMAFVLFHYAIHCLQTHGEFDPQEHLGEEYIRSYSARLYEKNSSQATVLSALRRVRSGGVAAPKQSRSKVAHPYSPKEWSDLQSTARQWPNEEATLLLTLAGSMGLRSPEIKEARSDWVDVDRAGRVSINVVSSDGTFRVVPAFGLPANIIRSASERSDGYLFNAHLINRANAVNRLTSRLSEEFKVFEGFTAGRARNTYIARLLEVGVPLPIVCVVGGIKAGVQLPTDLLPWMREFTDAEIREALSEKMRKGQR